MSQAQETSLECHASILSVQGEENAGYSMLCGSLLPCTEKTDQKSMTGGEEEGNPSPSSAEAFNLCKPVLLHMPQHCQELYINSSILKQGKFNLTHSLLDSLQELRPSNLIVYTLPIKNFRTHLS